MSSPSKPFKETLNLPDTRFDMKANLTVKEPRIQQRWDETSLYQQIRQARAGRPRRVLHDGPPYANGEIHVGHLLNKVLKDIVVRCFTMSGYDSPYVPGWDCHGLPIEHRVMKDLGATAAQLSHAEIRQRCQVDASRWVDLQRSQFKRLGVLGDWDHPYLTMDPRYEAGILDVLADLVDRGFVYRQLRPIHWCMTDRTALAEAELEYREESTPSVFVLFPVVSGLPAAWGSHDWRFMIWTTTPWTLPANVAIAAHPQLSYAAVRFGDPESGQPVHAVLAEELVGRVLALRGITEFEILGRAQGQTLEHARYHHAFLERTGPLVLADYVSVDDGTGLVHTAPGHGTEDYHTGQKYGLPILSPVDAAGRFTVEAPESLQGTGVFQANPIIIELLRSQGALYHQQPLVHSYPHCWRCKKPVIFRATDQWFIQVDRDGLRERTLEEIDRVGWFPRWGQARIESMVQNRPDWCISRQRSWGVPIPAFGCQDCGHLLLTAASVRHVRDLFRQHGADAWYTLNVDELLPPQASCPGCGGHTFRKENDILDVWFESGSSHHAVLDEPTYGLGSSPAYLYLEGSDQHRGWFQSSILTAVAQSGQAPFQNVLTHGFVVDDQGKKMSKTEGNVVHAVKATEQYGADVLRLYVASMDYAEDVRMSERGIKEASEAYRKIRNTFRFLLGNLEDYRDLDPAALQDTPLPPIDQWALGRLNQVIRDVTAAYERFDFYRAYQKLYQFCAVDLSSFYLDVLKDRLYAEAAQGPQRRAAQFVLARLHDQLTRLIAPILPHTAEELWDFIPGSDSRPPSVHLCRFPEPDTRFDDPDRDALWTELRETRDLVLVALEAMRKEKQIGSAQEARVQITTGPAQAARLDPGLLATLCIVAEVQLVTAPDATGPVVTAEKAGYKKCERCWNLRPTVGTIPAQPTLCQRCAEVLDSKP